MSGAASPINALASAGAGIGTRQNPLLPMLGAALATYGRNGDSMLVHVNLKEAARLMAQGGSGTRNPATGLLEFGNDGSGESNGNGNDGNGSNGSDSGGGAGAGGGGMSSGSDNSNAPGAGLSLGAPGAPGISTEGMTAASMGNPTGGATGQAAPNVGGGYGPGAVNLGGDNETGIGGGVGGYSIEPGYSAATQTAFGKVASQALTSILGAAIPGVGPALALGSALSSALGYGSLSQNMIEHGDSHAANTAGTSNGDMNNNPLLGFYGQGGFSGAFARGGIVAPNQPMTAGHGGPVHGGHGGVDDVHGSAGAGSLVLSRDHVAAIGHGDPAAGMHFLTHLFHDARGGPAGPQAVDLTRGEFVVSPKQLALLGAGDPHRGAAMTMQMVQHKQSQLGSR